MNSSINIAKSLAYALLISLLVGACTQSTSSMDSTIQSLVGAVTGTPTVMPASETNPPTLEQAIADRDEQIPEDIYTVMTDLETEASGKIPVAVTIESQWNYATEDDLRYVTYGRDSQGRIVWQTVDGTTFSEYPISWVVDRKGSHLVEGQKFGVIPDSEDAVVVFSGDGAGDKPIPVKTIVEAEDGQQYFLQYFDLQEGIWKLNVQVLAVLDENLQDLRIEVINPYLAIAMDSQATYVNDEIEIIGYFDLSKQEWVYPPEGKSMSIFVENGVPVIITTIVSVDEIATTPFPSSSMSLYDDGYDEFAGVKMFFTRVYGFNIGGYTMYEMRFNPGTTEEVKIDGASILILGKANGKNVILEVPMRDGWYFVNEDTEMHISPGSLKKNFTPGTDVYISLATIPPNPVNSWFTTEKLYSFFAKHNVTKPIQWLAGFGNKRFSREELEVMLFDPREDRIILPPDLIWVLSITPINHE